MSNTTFNYNVTYNPSSSCGATTKHSYIHPTYNSNQSYHTMPIPCLIQKIVPTYLHVISQHTAMVVPVQSVQEPDAVSLVLKQPTVDRRRHLQNQTTTI